VNSKGQTLLEGVLGTLTLFICCQGVLWLFVLIENSMVIHHILYEALICTQLKPPSSDCELKAKHLIDTQAIGSNLVSLQIKSNPQRVEAQVKVRPPWGKDWTLKDNLQIPLKVAQ